MGEGAKTISLQEICYWRMLDFRPML